MTVFLRIVEAVYGDGWNTQHTGIVIGVVVYVLTLISVLLLMIFGGSFRRMKEQAEQYQKEGPAAFKKPSTRAKLYDHLLEAREKLPVKPDVPDDRLMGKYITMRPQTELSSDTDKLFEISDGSARYDHGIYNSEDSVWAFLPHGPFQSVGEMKSSSLGQQPDNGLRLVITDKFSNNTIGSISLLENVPDALRIAIGDFWLTPAYQDKHYVYIECYFLLLDFLFDAGYRRVALSLDADDSISRKRVEQLGFTLEGVLRKHMVVREASRDSATYSLLNNEWLRMSEKFKKKLKENEKLPAYQIWIKQQNRKLKDEEFKVRIKNDSEDEQKKKQ